MQKEHLRALLLNADYSAVGLVKWKTAITAEFKGVVNVVDFYKNDCIKCADGTNWPVPAVIALREYQRVKYKDIPFSRKNVFMRDRLICQYCNKRFHWSKLTYDHVIPRSKWKKKGTPTCWDNIVTCCYPCNHRKADSLPEEIGMIPKRQPSRPNPHLYVVGLCPWTVIRKEWKQYIPKHYLDILEIEND